MNLRQSDNCLRFMMGIPIHREYMPTWLPWPRFNASLHNFPPLWGTITHCWTCWQHEMHFRVALLIMVIEIWFNFQIYVQCAEKPFLKSLSIADEILSKFDVRGTPEYQRATWKGLRTMGSEWPDKTGFGCVARGGVGVGGIFFMWSSSPA